MKQVAALTPWPDLAAFLSPCAPPFRRSEGREALERSSTGLLSALPRKNAQTIASAVPGTNSQRLEEVVTGIQWQEMAVNGQRGERMRDEGVLGDGVLLGDDTSFVKQGTASGGVARQYCGSGGKVANGQVAVTCGSADPAVHWPVDVRVYLPQEWAEDPIRRQQAGVPEEVPFQPKPEVALTLGEEARALKIPPQAVVPDAGYGSDPAFLEGLETRGESEVVAVPWDFSGEGEEEPSLGSRRADAVLQSLPRRRGKTGCWREGAKGKLRRKFVALRGWRTVGGPRKQLGWLLGERPARGQQGEGRYSFSNLPSETPLKRLVELAPRRWPIERFQEDGKDLLGGTTIKAACGRGFPALPGS